MVKTTSLEREHVMLSQILKEEKEYQISYKGLMYDSLQRPVNGFD
jgi:hypothetical protein